MTPPVDLVDHYVAVGVRRQAGLRVPQVAGHNEHTLAPRDPHASMAMPQVVRRVERDASVCLVHECSQREGTPDSCWRSMADGSLEMDERLPRAKERCQFVILRCERFA